MRVQVFVIGLWAVHSILSGQAVEPPPAPTTKTLTLAQCLDMALEKNHRRPASQFAIAMAEAQHRQALAAYWPQVSGTAGYQRLSNPLNFLFPASAIGVPGQSVTIPGGAVSVTLPAGSILPGFPPADMQVPINFPAQNITTTAQTFRVPEQNVKVLDQNLVAGGVKAQWLLWDGGMRKGYREQTNGLIDMMKAEARRTDLEVLDSVRRMYWGAVLAGQLRKLGGDTLERMEMTLRLTETMYKGAGGKVSKSDYLDNMVTVETIRSMVAELEKNHTMAKAALAYNLGLAWNASVEPSDTQIPGDTLPLDLNGLVAESYEFNPDWKKLEAGLRAAEGQATTAKSAYFPQLGVEGSLNRAWNGGYNSGLATSQNLSISTVKVGLEIPIFNGFLTKNRLAEARAQIGQIKESRFLLKEGLGLQIRDLVTSLAAAAKTREASEKAMQAASENRDLNMRAYRDELVDTEKVIRAQLMEAFMSAMHYKSRYDCLSRMSELGTVVGTGLRDRLRGVVVP